MWIVMSVYNLLRNDRQRELCDVMKCYFYRHKINLIIFINLKK